MDNLNKSLFTSNQDELRKIYEDEARKLHENEFKLNLLKKIRIEDFSRELSESSKRNIEKALLAVRIKDHINLEGGKKVLGLDEMDLSKINLGYLEKKLIRERIEHLITQERKKRAQMTQVTDELEKIQENFIRRTKQNIELTEKLAELKNQELELLKDIADILVSPSQIQQAQGILEEARIVQLQSSCLNGLIIDAEMEKTNFKEALSEVSSCIDEALQEKEGTSTTK